MLILRKEAEEDIKKAHHWYESQQKGLGMQFLDEVERQLKRIDRRPSQFPQVDRSVRRALCRRFPYALYFILDDAGVVVLAVLHHRRHRPATWNRGE